MKDIKFIRPSKSIGSWFTKGKKYSMIDFNKAKDYIVVINDNGDHHELTKAFVKANKIEVIR